MSERKTEFLTALSRSERRLVEKLLCEPPMAREHLRKDLKSYLEGLEIFAQTDEFMDLQTAREVAHRCHILVDSLQSDHGSENHLIVQAAVRYFLLDEDAEGDRASPIGFDDDARVVAAAEKALADKMLSD